MWWSRLEWWAMHRYVCLYRNILLLVENSLNLMIDYLSLFLLTLFVLYLLLCVLTNVSHSYSLYLEHTHSILTTSLSTHL